MLGEVAYVFGDWPSHRPHLMRKWQIKDGLRRLSPLHWMFVTVVHSYRSRVCGVTGLPTVCLTPRFSSAQIVLGVCVAYIAVSGLFAFRFRGRLVSQKWLQMEVRAALVCYRVMHLPLCVSAYCTYSISQLLYLCISVFLLLKNILTQSCNQCTSRIMMWRVCWWAVSGFRLIYSLGYHTWVSNFWGM